MKKELTQKISEFIRKESNLMTRVEKVPGDTKAAADLMKLRAEKNRWLTQVGGGKSVVKPEDVVTLENLVREAASEITRAAKINKKMVEYIETAIKENMAGYERVVEDYGQLEALAEMSAQSIVKKLDKLNSRVNGKGFLNVVMCKFKKSKMQENEKAAESVEIEK